MLKKVKNLIAGLLSFAMITLMLPSLFISRYPSNQTHLPTPVKTCDNVLKNKVGALKWIKTKLITGLNK